MTTSRGGEVETFKIYLPAAWRSGSNIRTSDLLNIGRETVRVLLTAVLLFDLFTGDQQGTFSESAKEAIMKDHFIRRD